MRKAQSHHQRTLIAWKIFKLLTSNGAIIQKYRTRKCNKVQMQRHKQPMNSVCAAKEKNWKKKVQTEIKTNKQIHPLKMMKLINVTAIYLCACTPFFPLVIQRRQRNIIITLYKTRYAFVLKVINFHFMYFHLFFCFFHLLLLLLLHPASPPFRFVNDKNKTKYEKTQKNGIDYLNFFQMSLQRLKKVNWRHQTASVTCIFPSIFAYFLLFSFQPF